MSRSKGIGIFVLLLILLVPAAAHGLNGNNEDKIIKGRVFINDVFVGGMEVEQARKILREKMEPLPEKKVVFSSENRTWEVPSSDLGFEPDIESAVKQAGQLGKKGPVVEMVRERWEVALEGKRINIPVRLKQKDTLRKLKEIGKEIEQKEQNAKFHFHGQNPEVVPHINGRKLEYEKTLNNLLSTIKAESPEKKDRYEVQLSLEEIYPKIRTEDLKNRSMTTVAGEYTTYFDPGKVGRTKNIATAVRYLDGTVIPPGATFSFNETVGPRTQETGFEEALIIIGKEFIPGLGGGVCQVSSTLYNAALRAGMKITERSQHSRTITYVPIGLDATVSYGILDLKFENTTNYFVAICGEVNGSALNIKILGEKQNPCNIEIKPIIENTVKPKTETKIDSEMEKGKEFIENIGKNGYVTRVERLWLNEGGMFKREIISRDFYPAESRVIIKGNLKKGKNKSRQESGSSLETGKEKMNQ